MVFSRSKDIHIEFQITISLDHHISSDRRKTKSFFKSHIEQYTFRQSGGGGGGPILFRCHILNYLIC